MFDNSFNGNRKQFWKCIRAKRKDHHNISILVVDGETISDTVNKANALNNYFQSVFTKETLTNIPSMNECDNCESFAYYAKYYILSNITGIQHQLSLLDTNKASGPNNIHSYIYKNCAYEIAPILQVIFSQSFDIGILPSD